MIPVRWQRNLPWLTEKGGGLFLLGGLVTVDECYLTYNSSSQLWQSTCTYQYVRREVKLQALLTEEPPRRALYKRKSPTACCSSWIFFQSRSDINPTNRSLPPQDKKGAHKHVKTTGGAVCIVARAIHTREGHSNHWARLGSAISSQIYKRGQGNTTDTHTPMSQLLETQQTDINQYYQDILPAEKLRHAASKNRHHLGQDPQQYMVLLCGTLLPVSCAW